MAERKEKKEARDKYEQLSLTHPDYNEWEAQWKLERDLLGEAEVNLREYLPQGEFESPNLYQNRLKLAEFIPETPIAINKILGSIYSQKPVRKFVSESTKSFSKNVDLKGTNWDDYAQRLCRRLTGYGTIRALVNIRRPGNVPAGEELSVAQERALKMRPYVVNYSPLSVIDWETDFYGRLTMVRIRETRTVSSLSGKAEHDKIVRFMEYDTQVSRWWEFRVQGQDEGMEVELNGQPGELPHNLGMVPMVVENYPEELKPMIGAGFIRWMGRADKRKIQVESDLHYDAYVHAHPQMVYKGREDKGRLGLAGSNYLKIKEDEDLYYLQLPPSIAEALHRIIDLNVQTMNRHAGTDPLGQLSGGAAIYEASGVSRAWSFGTSEARILKDIALKMQRVETLVFELVERWQAPRGTPVLDPDEQLFKGYVQYAQEFDPSSRTQLMDDTERARDLVNSESLGKLLCKRLAALLAGEAKPEDVQKILREIERNPLLGWGMSSAEAVEVSPQASMTVDDLAPQDEPAAPSRRTERRRNRIGRIQGPQPGGRSHNLPAAGA